MEDSINTRVAPNALSDPQDLDENADDDQETERLSDIEEEDENEALFWLAVDRYHNRRELDVTTIAELAKALSHPCIGSGISKPLDTVLDPSQFTQADDDLV